MIVESHTVTLDLAEGRDRFYAVELFQALDNHANKIDRADLRALRIVIAHHSGSVQCAARPVGTDQIPACFVCGAGGNASGLMSNICLMVGSQDEAEQVLGMIKGARIAYYHGDRNVPQVKVGACQEHRAALNALYLATETGDKVSQWIVDQSRRVSE